MKLPSWQTIIKTNYEEKYQELIETLGFSINTAMDNIFNTFNRKISLKDNIYCVVKDIEVKVDSTGLPKPSVTFNSDIATAVQGISVINVLNLENAKRYADGGLTISFTQNGNTITITNIAGLYPSEGTTPLTDKYRIKLIAWG